MVENLRKMEIKVLRMKVYDRIELATIVRDVTWTVIQMIKVFFSSWICTSYLEEYNSNDIVSRIQNKYIKQLINSA